MPSTDFSPSGFVAVRTPLLPFGVLEDLSRESLRGLLLDPVVREALFLASPDLESRIAVWFEKPNSDEGQRLEIAIVKYVSRMASRCTPFGLFAGNTVATLGDTTSIRLRARETGLRHTRLDMEFLESVIHRLVRDPNLRPRIPFRTNTSLYPIGQTVRYAEPRETNVGERSHFLVDVEGHEHLYRILDRARTPGLLAELAAAAVDDDVSLEVALEFAEQLVEAGILLPDLGPNVTGEDATSVLLKRLSDTEVAKDAATALRQLLDGLREMDEHGVGRDPSEYRKLMTVGSALARVVPKHFVQVDLAKPAEERVVDIACLQELAEATEVLVSLFARRGPGPLAGFRDDFETRYGEALVPLVEVLDEEVGIGFQRAEGPGSDASPLIAGLPFPTQEEEETVSFGSRGRYLLWVVADAIAAGRDEVLLDPKDLRRFQLRPDDAATGKTRGNTTRTTTGTTNGAASTLADAIHVHATLLRADPEDRTAPIAVLDTAGGPSGVRLLGRFCHADPELEAHVRTHIREEQSLHPQVRYFELVHLPEGRTGNILARPILRDLELEFLGASGAPRDQVLQITDLFLTVRHGRVLLWSRSLQCEVRPRITSAHDARWKSLGVYRFLSALQGEGHVEGTTWDWGPLESQPRLPRVRFGRIVLARAQWRVTSNEIQRFRKLDGEAAFDAIQSWRVDRNIPRWVGLIYRENVLTVDLEQRLSVAAFLHTLRSHDVAVVQEVFPGRRTDMVQGPDGDYVNEIIVPMVRKLGAAIPAGTRRTAVRDRRLFAPGSEWLSAKVYCGVSTADAVLQEVLRPLASDALQSGAVDRWFFLRFGDPEWHLRLRFHGDPDHLLGRVLPALHRALDPRLADRRVDRWVVDSYEPEVERYGGLSAIPIVEEIFYRDSDAVVQFLEAVPGDEALEARWRFAFVALDRLLTDFGLGLAEKRRLCSLLSESFALEFGADAPFRKAVGARYRDLRSYLEASLKPSPAMSEPEARVEELLHGRTSAWQSRIGELHDLQSIGELEVSFDEIVASLMHMHVNRVLRSSQRAQELILYEYLARVYSTFLARSGGGEKP